MKKRIGLMEKLKRERGIALIVIVLFYFLVATFAISEDAIRATLAGRDADVKFALTMGEATSVETTAPIRDEIAEYLHEQVHGAITQHLISDSGSSPYQCQGVLVVPSTGNKNQLNSQYGICNPITLLNKLPSKSQQTINNLLTVLPHLNNSHNKDDKIIYDELARELRNEYDYTLKAAYIGEQLIVPPKSKTDGGQPAPRIEQYRWLVRAEIETHTYNAISFPLTVNYDVVVNM